MEENMFIANSLSLLLLICNTDITNYGCSELPVNPLVPRNSL